MSDEVQVQEVKAFLQSKTIKGLLLTGVTALAHAAFGVTLGADAAEEATMMTVNVLCALVELGGLVWAAYGRKVAAGPLVATKAQAEAINQTAGQVAADKPAGQVAAVLFLGLLLPAALAGPASAADAAYLQAAAATWLVNVAYLVTGLAFALVAFWAFDKWALRGVETAKELAEGNWSVAIVVAALFLVVAMIVTKGMV